MNWVWGHESVQALEATTALCSAPFFGRRFECSEAYIRAGPWYDPAIEVAQNNEPWCSPRTQIMHYLVSKAKKGHKIFSLEQIISPGFSKSASRPRSFLPKEF